MKKTALLSVLAAIAAVIVALVGIIMYIMDYKSLEGEALDMVLPFVSALLLFIMPLVSKKNVLMVVPVLATFVGYLTLDLNDSYGVLDWGRGVWTYSNTWYWSSMSGMYNGNIMGFNLGYGFGDTSKASENVFFYKDKAYKLEDVCFNIPNDGTKQINYMDKWHFTSSDNSIDMIFEPIIDRFAALDVVVLKSIQHQVFGKFSGYVMIDGKKIEFKDMLGFAEKVRNCW